MGHSPATSSNCKAYSKEGLSESASPEMEGTPPPGLPVNAGSLASNAPSAQETLEAWCGGGSLEG